MTRTVYKEFKHQALVNFFVLSLLMTPVTPVKDYSAFPVLYLNNTEPVIAVKYKRVQQQFVNTNVMQEKNILISSHQLRLKSIAPWLLYIFSHGL